MRDLRYFLAVAEELSFTRAAARMHVSQPALSKQVRALETRLGAELFTRGHRSIALTAAGTALLPRARGIVVEWERAGAEVRAVAGTTRRTITVGFHTRIGRGLVPAITAALAERMPGWRLRFRQVDWGDPSVGLRDGSVDVAVGWLPVPGPGIAHRVAATEARWVALPVEHRLAGRDVVPFAELTGEPFVALPASAGPMREFWLAAEQRRAPAAIGAEAATADEAFEAVASGLGVVLLAAGNAAIYRRDDIVCRPVPDLPACELAVLWRADDRRPAVRVVTDACCRSVATDAAARDRRPGGDSPSGL
ncbi:LysR family transcriptional regulator [Pseudonocardia humida]|uniref:LysR family transcriptional regulator n=1 Tax=Pseudonocardia humida TaxID=2800819 RepID=UPI00207CAA0B|nr:LysR substrate-binding domain-containing protein [Pseudonocardia humida]